MSTGSGQVHGVGKGSLVEFVDNWDNWYFEGEARKTYRVWTSTDTDGGCTGDGDSSMAVRGNGGYDVDRRGDIDWPTNLCSEAIIRMFGGSKVNIEVGLRSARLDYYLWIEEVAGE